jgi:hypothetical protein
MTQLRTCWGSTLARCGADCIVRNGSFGISSTNARTFKGTAVRCLVARNQRGRVVNPPEHFRSGAAPTSRAINLTTTQQGLHAVLLCVRARGEARHPCCVDTANAAVPKSFLFQRPAPAGFPPTSAEASRVSIEGWVPGRGPTFRKRRNVLGPESFSACGTVVNVAGCAGT